MRTANLLAIALLFAAAGSPARTQDSLLPGPLRTASIEMPRAWPTVVEALVAAHRQTGLAYAVVHPRFQGLVGPYEVGQAVKLDRLVRAVAAASGTVARAVGSVVVFDRPGTARPKPGEDPRLYAHRLGQVGASSTIAELSRLAGSEDASVRLHALAGLHRMEGDFLRRAWPGRVSIFEVMRGRLDRQALLWVVSEADRQATKSWLMAVDILARSREPYLARHTWTAVWSKVPGTMRQCLWAMGRSGDATAGRALGKRVRKSFTNDPADRYLAGVALGELNEEGELRRNARHANPEVRRAAVLGLGLCRETTSLLDQLGRSLADKDPGVRFLACQALGRVGTAKSLARLRSIAQDRKAPAELRCAALDGLALAPRDAGLRPILAAASDPDPAIRAKVADLLGRAGGRRAFALLTALVDDADRRVRASAACALGSLGSGAAVARAVKYLENPKTDADGRIAAMIGLGRGRSPLAKDALSRVALDTTQNRRLRRYAVLALAQLANRAGQNTLKKLTAFGTARYMQFALRHLELSTPTETARYVTQYLARGHRDTSAGAAARLADLGNGTGVRELLEGSDVFDNHSRMMHMWGAVRARGPGVVAALVEATKSKRSDIRTSAALALGGRIDVAAVDALIRLTHDRSSGVRSAAAQSLGLCGDPKAVPALIDLAAKDDSPRVVSAAIRALRLRAFSHRADVRALFKTLAGTERDAGVIDPDRPPLAAQPDHSFVLRRWAAALDDDDMCNVTYETSLAYDSHRARVVLWGAHGRRADAPQTGQTWFFHADTGKWNRLTTSHEWPNATCCVWGLTYDPANRVVISPTSGRGGHGWVNALRVNMQYSHPWLLDTRTDQWYPVKPSKHKGAQTGFPGTFDPRHAVSVWWQGGSRVKAYDAYSNEWWTMSLSGRANAQRSGTPGGRFDPKTGRYIIVGNRSTWAYDPATNAWTDLRPQGSGPPGCRMVYDSANDVMLVFKANRGKGVEVAVYHLRENRWERLPLVHPSPHYGTFDIAYDSRNNVTVISGGWETGRSAETTARETWTYRYKRRTAKADNKVGRPRSLSLKMQPGGRIKLSWKPPRRGTARGYRVYRGVGDRAWLAEWTRIARLDADELSCSGIVRDPKELRFYRVTAVDSSGREGPASYPVRTAPPALRWAAAVFDGRGVRVTWPASPDKNVVGYHVYRAPVAARSHWARAFNPATVHGKFKRITSRPVAVTEYLDTGAKVKGPASELAWPDTFAYVVRAVNVWGLESGESPTTLAVPDAPGPVRVIPWLDGRRLVLWRPGRGGGVRGYYVMRMDDWNRKYVFRWHASPIMSCGFYDGWSFPTSDRRRYYVSGVDVLGAVGIPSSGAWSHGFP